MSSRRSTAAVLDQEPPMPSRDLGLEQDILGSPNRMPEGLDYARDVLKARWDEWEIQVLQYIGRKTFLLGICTMYARDVIHGRWQSLEAILLQLVATNEDAESTVVDYACDVIKGQWKELEDSIWSGQCPALVAVDYTSRVLKASWPKLENFLLTSTPDVDVNHALVKYAADVLKSRWPDAEKFFLAQPTSEESAAAAYWYAKDVIKAPWAEGEHLLLGDTIVANLYSLDVVKGRLSDQLHSNLVLLSFDLTDDEGIKEYIKRHPR
jgi:hypothetical protein